MRLLLYEVSLGISERAKLLSIPVPSGATEFVKGISATIEPYFIRLWATEASCFGADAQRAGIGFEQTYPRVTSQNKRE